MKASSPRIGSGTRLKLSGRPRDARLAPASTPGTGSEDALIAAARKARRHAHAPYSRFLVGAAVIDDQGRIHVGCNVENASYGLTTCAERNAVAAAVVAGARRIAGAAVVTKTRPPAAPCGACRQVLSEFGDGDLPVWLAPPRDGAARATVHRLDALLPQSFALSSFERTRKRTR